MIEKKTSSQIIFELKKTVKEIVNFCEAKGIEKTLANFLTFKSLEKQHLPDNINFIMSGDYCKEIICCSKAFMSVYESLAIDFKQDLDVIANPSYYHKVTAINKKYKDIAIRFLKEDYIYYALLPNKRV